MLSGSVITFTSDFGDRDSYAAEMKGSVLEILARRNESYRPILVDVTHDVPRHDVNCASMIVPALADSFPTGTIHIVVVDPGVGSNRRPIAIRRQSSFFVGPDNGVFTDIIENDAEIIEIDSGIRREHAHPSAVFDGRDLFAPAAALLASGADFHELGVKVTDPVRLARPMPILFPKGITGQVTGIDVFGNLRTNIVAANVPRGAELRIGNSECKLAASYSNIEEGALAALVSSNGVIEIAANRRSAGDIVGAAIGMKVEVTW